MPWNMPLSVLLCVNPSLNKYLKRKYVSIPSLNKYLRRKNILDSSSSSELDYSDSELDCVSHGRPCAKCFSCFISLSPHKNPLKVSIPIFQMRLSTLYHTTIRWQRQDSSSLSLNPEPTHNHYSANIQWSHKKDPLLCIIIYI